MKLKKIVFLFPNSFFGMSKQNTFGFSNNNKKLINISNNYLFPPPTYLFSSQKKWTFSKKG